MNDYVKYQDTEPLTEDDARQIIRDELEGKKIDPFPKAINNVEYGFKLIGWAVYIITCLSVAVLFASVSYVLLKQWAH